MTTSKPFSPPSKSISPYWSHIGAAHQHSKQQKPLERSPSAQSTVSTKSYERRPSLASRRAHSNTSCAKIMAELLPEKLDMRAAKKSTGSPVGENERWRESSSTLHGVPSETSVPSVVVMPLRESRSAICRQPHRRAGQAAGFPTVVIQNPTPHSTRPGTPVSSQPASPQRHASLHARQNSLLVQHVPSRGQTTSTAFAPSTPESPSSSSSSRREGTQSGSVANGVVVKMEGDDGVRRPCDSSEGLRHGGPSGVQQDARPDRRPHHNQHQHHHNRHLCSLRSWQ